MGQRLSGELNICNLLTGWQLHELGNEGRLDLDSPVTYLSKSAGVLIWKGDRITLIKEEKGNRVTTKVQEEL